MRSMARRFAVCFLVVQGLLASARAAGPDLKPIALLPNGAGELLVLDSRRGIFALDIRSGKVRTLVSGFGVFSAVDMTASPVASDGSILVTISLYKPDGVLSRVIRFNAAGKRSGEWGWSAAERVMPSGIAIDPGNRIAYVANSQRPEIYRLDLSRPSSRPVSFLTVRGAKALGPMVLDARRSRLLVADPVRGTVHSVDLAGKGSTTFLKDLGEPYALLIDSAADRLYIADASGERILTANLAEGAAVAKTYAKLKSFSDPHALALGADGALWVGDEKEEAVFLVSREGTLIRTISLD